MSRRLACAREVKIEILAAATRKRGAGRPRSACEKEGRVGAGRRGGCRDAVTSEVAGGSPGELATAFSQKREASKGKAPAVGASRGRWRSGG